jgi:protein-L-isoaspartate(D-aspartate) O-methyltransferase
MANFLYASIMNDYLTNYLIKRNVLKTPIIIDAFSTINRKDFIPEEYTESVNIDAPIPIGHGQTNSQPYTVAFMLELLAPESGQKILDVGSGSGWTTALLAKIVGQNGKVFGIERIPELVQFGRSSISKYKFSNAKILMSKNELGLSEEALFDRILVSAAAEKLPKELINQLKNEGVMVIPIKNSVYRIIKNKNGKIETSEFSGFAFVPLII